MKEKVYCKKCSYFKGNHCWYPENIKEYDQWDDVKVFHKELPKILNMHNDCAWFVKK